MSAEPNELFIAAQNMRIKAKLVYNIYIWVVRHISHDMISTEIQIVMEEMI